MVTSCSLGSNGEFGNQLFQIAAVYGYARKWNMAPAFNSWVCSVTHQNFYEIFDKRLQINDNIPVEKLVKYLEPFYHYREIPNYRQGVDLSGYFQSEKYFDNCADEIRNLFSLPTAIKSYMDSMGISKIITEQDFAGIHMRFYTRSSRDHHAVHGSLTNKYFSEALDRIGRDRSYIVCTDNKELAMEFFKYQKVGTYIISSHSQLVDFFILTQVRDVIMSNSSFSWWGAWLNNTGGRVISPAHKKWFTEEYIAKSKVVTADILPERWIQI